MTLESYQSDPCGLSSIPFWKAKCISVPDSIKIVHNADFDQSMLKHYFDQPYFRLKHSLHELPSFELPDHFNICSASVIEYVEHINSCYEDLHISVEELQSYCKRPVYCSELWLAIRDERTGMIVATGIGELDYEIGEGVLEWIQVSNACRGLGIGKYMVQELLRRMKGRAEFVTVSGQCSNPSNPEALYRTCGFTGDDIWHILTEK